MPRTTIKNDLRVTGNLEVLGSIKRGAGFVVIPDAATYTVLAANSGKTHIFPNLTADCTVTMPAEVSGLEYTFIYGGVAADAQDWIFDTGSNTNYYLGGVVHLDSDADAAGDEVVPVASDGNSNSKLTINVPNVGTKVEFICDGTLWYVNGQAVATAAPVFADQ